jgi:hypothetical protein
MSDVAALVEKATAPGTFSVLDAIKGRSYPEDDVTVYTDAAAAYEIRLLEEKIADVEDGNEVNALDAELERLKHRVRDSKMVFHLRGFNRGVIDGIMKQGREKFPWEDKLLPDPLERGEGARWANAYYVAESIIRVTDSQGNVDEHHWDVDEVMALQATLPDDVFEKILDKTIELSFAALFFDQTVTPDFS